MNTNTTDTSECIVKKGHKQLLTNVIFFFFTFWHSNIVLKIIIYSQANVAQWLSMNLYILNIKKIYHQILYQLHIEIIFWIY